MLLQEVEDHSHKGCRLVLSSKTEEHNTIVESLPLRQVEAYTLRDSCLAYTRDAEHCCQPVL